VLSRLRLEEHPSPLAGEVTEQSRDPLQAHEIDLARPTENMLHPARTRLRVAPTINAEMLADASPRRSREGGRAAAPLFVLLACACATHRPPEPPPVDTREGKTDYRVVSQAERGPAEVTASTERVTTIFASEDNPRPEYPAYALKAGCRDGVVPVRILIGTDGNVSGQQDIPERPLPNDPCLVAFRAAVQSTVARWRFSPAFRQQPIPDPERPGVVRWRQSPIAVFVDYEFLFRVVDGKGVVEPR
jgi:hypothetical protein